MYGEPEMSEVANFNPTCPFCGSADSCGHLLATFDEIFETIEGEYLYKAKEHVWETIEAGLHMGKEQAPE